VAGHQRAFALHLLGVGLPDGLQSECFSSREALAGICLAAGFDPASLRVALRAPHVGDAIGLGLELPLLDLALLEGQHVLHRLVLRARNVAFQNTPDTYYDLLATRLPNHGEDTARLKDNRVLIDGAPAKNEMLLQIFTTTVVGQIFFEIIQRKGNEGFGEGNFQALFESIELDQIRRGVLKD